MARLGSILRCVADESDFFQVRFENPPVGFLVINHQNAVQWQSFHSAPLVQSSASFDHMGFGKGALFEAPEKARKQASLPETFTFPQGPAEPDGQVLRLKRLLDKIYPLIQSALLSDHISGVAGHEQTFDAGMNR